MKKPENHKLTIRRSSGSDYCRIMEIYASARTFMAEHGNPYQWGTDWPPEDLIRNDIISGNSFVCVNDKGTVIGTFYFIFGPDIEPTYAVIENGNWMDKRAYGVVHRLAGDGSEPGIGASCLNWAYEQCGHIRIDTHHDNKVMQSLLEKQGFQYCGIIYVRDGTPRMAYEKS